MFYLITIIILEMSFKIRLDISLEYYTIILPSICQENRQISLKITFLKNLFYLFIYFWLHWVFVAVHGLSLAVASGGCSLLRCAGFSLWWLLLLQNTGSRCTGFSSCGMRASVVVARGLQSAGSVVVVHGLSCSAACGIFLDQDSNPCPLHWQADS